MVDYSSLENYRAERHRGFESLSLRKKEQSARVALFVYAIRVLTFFQSLRFMKAPLRVERESLSLRISTSLQARFAIQRENNYKKTGSSKAAFQTGCGTALFVPALGFAAWLVQELSTE